MQSAHYVIRGGIEGRERLRVLSQVLRPTTQALFDRVGIRAGMMCLDAGCGGGDVTFELGHRAGPTGRVLGLDMDGTQLDLARSEATASKIDNVSFHQTEIGAAEFAPEFDIVYARFLLTHLADPVAVIARMQSWLKPGGMLVIEDIDFSGHFCHPESASFQRYVELYTYAVQRRGGDPHIGPRIPPLLVEAGYANVEMHVVQPAGIEGEVKLLNPLTMENIADAVIADGLASHSEVSEIIADLYEFARNPRTVASLPRIVQTWGRKPAG